MPLRQHPLPNITPSLLDCGAHISPVCTVPVIMLQDDCAGVTWRSCNFCVGTNPAVFAGAAEEPNTWMLVDGNSPEPQFSGGQRVIVMTSPSPSKYSEFVKGRQVLQIGRCCMPWCFTAPVHAAISLKHPGTDSLTSDIDSGTAAASCFVHAVVQIRGGCLYGAWRSWRSAARCCTLRCPQPW